MLSARRLMSLALLAGLGAAAATRVAASDEGVSRAQVRAATAAAVTAHAIPVGEATPDSPKSFASARPRALVRAETLTAMAAGTIERGEAASAYPRPFEPTVTRAEVNAETIAAIGLGLIAHGEQPLHDATPAEEENIRQAGLRAHDAPARRPAGAPSGGFHM